MKLMKALSLIALSVQSALGLQEKPIRRDNANSAQLLAAGLTGNNPYSLLLAESDDGGNNWVLPNITGAPESAALVSASSVFTNEGVTAIAVGEDLTGYQPPLIIQKRAGGNWTNLNISARDFSGIFTSSSCAATNSSDICVAVGQFDDGTSLLTQAVNGNWSWVSIPQDAYLYSVSCTVNSQDIECFAAGNAIFHNTNGQAWEKVFTNGTISLSAIGCYPGNAGISCVAAGGASSLVESYNTSQWKTIQVPEETIFESVSCAGANKTCLAVGYGMSTNPIIAQRLNGQWSWQTSIPGVQEGVMSGASCIDDGSENGFCVAVGGEVGNIWPIIAEWSNGNWTFPNITAPGGLNSVSCFMSDPDTKKCIAGGFGGTGPHYADNAPLLMERNEAGNWTVISSLDVPSPGQYWGTTALVFGQPTRERNYQVGKTLEVA